MRSYIIFLIVLVLWGCEDEKLTHSQYIDIGVKITRLKLGGYDGYVETDMEITNTSDFTLNGWEARVEVTTTSYQLLEGIFFRHDINLAPGLTREYKNNILFYWDADHIYPLTLTSNDSTIREWDLVYVRGIVF